MSSRNISEKPPEYISRYCPPSKKTVAATFSVITCIAGGALIGIALLQLKGTGATLTFAAGAGLLTLSGFCFLDFAIKSCKKKTAPQKRPIATKNAHLQPPKKDSFGKDDTPHKSKIQSRKGKSESPASADCTPRESDLITPEAIGDLERILLRQIKKPIDNVLSIQLSGQFLNHGDRKKWKEENKGQQTSSSTHQLVLASLHSLKKKGQITEYEVIKGSREQLTLKITRLAC